MTDLTALLLAGGFGTRIRELYPDVPKPMIPVLGEPFLEWAIRYWKRQGAGRFVLSLGHLAEVAEHYFAHRAEVATIRETTPLGTGGAVLFAAAEAQLSDPFVVANGDSLVLADVSTALAAIAQDGVDGVVLGVAVEDASRYGSLAVDEAGRLLGFHEKRPGRGLINGGVYFFRRATLDRFPRKQPLSMELDVFPALLAAGADLRVVGVQAPFLDIGTPESVRQAEEFVRRLI
ncbi:MAG: NTP transferase domain-containing protein [Bryobacterales bacterium]|nr:NTP transferase domain-containing protein [Bryobacterales bacterium]